MFGEWAERISTAPISSQAARSAPISTWSEIGSRPSLIGLAPPARSRPRRPPRASRGAAPGSPPGARTRTGPRPRSRRGGSPRSTSASSHSPSKRARRLPRSRAPSSAARGRGSGPGSTSARRTFTSSTSAVGVAVAVTALVLGGELLGEPLGARALVAGDRELERLAAIAQLVGDLGGGVAEPLGQPLAERPHLRRNPLGGELVTAQHHRARGVAPALGGEQAERREHPARPRAEDPLHPELGGDRGRVHRPGAAEGHQREVARVDSALDRDDAQGAHHLGVRDPHDALGRGERLEPELVREPRDRGLRRVLVELDAAGQLRGRAEVAEHQVRVGDRRLGAAAPVAGRPRLRPRRARARPAARRRRRASRSSRRRPRPCARRPSAAG